MLRPHFASIVSHVLPFVLSTAVCDADDVWILAGQSNMRGGQALYGRALGELVSSHGRTPRVLTSSAPGKPIAAWLDAEHRDFPKLWTEALESGVRTARKEGHRFAGMVWYQGESDTDRHQSYEGDLRELVTRIRRLTFTPQLPIVVVQLAPRVGYRPDGGWDTALLREAQRRFVEADERAALVAAIDCPLKDYTVHLGPAGHAIVARRIVAAARHLVFDGPAHGWGPQVRRAFVHPEDAHGLVLEFEHVQGKLHLEGGWRQAFALSSFPAPARTLDTVPDVDPMHVAGSVRFANGARVVAPNRVVLSFDAPVTGGAVSLAASANAQFGPHRRWELEFDALRDESGAHAAAFALIEVEEAPGTTGPIPLPVTSSTPIDTDPEEPVQIAVNCIGRFPEAVLPREAEAGADGWRQPFWNPVSKYDVPNLFDRRGRVTSIGFRTGVWYMSPYFRELDTPDDALMASWCKNAVHGLHGLDPRAEYDLAVYILQGPPSRKTADPPPDRRVVRVTILHPHESGRRNRATMVREEHVAVPANGGFDGYVVRGSDEGTVGNVLVLERLRPDSEGRLDLAVEVEERRNDKRLWKETTLSGIQLRSRP